MITLWDFFIDPILCWPTIGSLFMCVGTALIGVLVYLQKRSLLGESLSHCVYPGIVLGVLAYKMFFSKVDLLIPVLLGGTATASLGLYSINFCVRKLKMSSDVALCFVLAAFFGLGFLAVSRVQFIYPKVYQQVQMFLYGQAATMRQVHALIYMLLCLGIVIFIILLFKHLQMIYFDREFAKSMSRSSHTVESLVFIMLIAAIVIGMRTVGIILMSGMLIAPAVSARQFTNKLSWMFFLAALVAAISAFFGNVISYHFSNHFSASFPIGPVIIVVATLIAILSLLFSPKRGIVFRYARIVIFKKRVFAENVLKMIFKYSEQNAMPIEKMKKMVHLPHWIFSLFLFHIQKQGWIKHTADEQIQLTKDGKNKALHVIRKHRLWETYLQHLGMQGEMIHANAEKMEHMITEEMESSLEEMLSFPKKDPHQKPIPQKSKYSYGGYELE